MIDPALGLSLWGLIFYISMPKHYASSMALQNERNVYILLLDGGITGNVAFYFFVTCLIRSPVVKSLSIIQVFIHKYVKIIFFRNKTLIEKNSTLHKNSRLCNIEIRDRANFMQSTGCLWHMQFHRYIITSSVLTCRVSIWPPWATKSVPVGVRWQALAYVWNKFMTPVLMSVVLIPSAIYDVRLKQWTVSQLTNMKHNVLIKTAMR